MPASGEFYRLVAGDEPTNEDFLNHHELLAVGRLRSKFWSDEKDCEAAGLSVSRELDDIKRLRQATGPMRKKKIARGAIDGAGVMMPTPRGEKHKSHHTWWRPVDDEAWQRFRIVA